MSILPVVVQQKANFSYSSLFYSLPGCCTLKGLPFSLAVRVRLSTATAALLQPRRRHELQNGTYTGQQRVNFVEGNLSLMATVEPAKRAKSAFFDFTGSYF